MMDFNTAKIRDDMLVIRDTLQSIIVLKIYSILCFNFNFSKNYHVGR